ncbi:MAG: hypothetical protein WCS42_17910, partial [Verrucomicrobiota bacterium]
MNWKTRANRQRISPFSKFQHQRVSSIIKQSCFLMLFFGCANFSVGHLQAEESKSTDITVHCDEIIGPRAHPEHYLNTSILQAPPMKLADRVVAEYARPCIMRCWLTLRQMWNPKTDTYNYNFQLPRRVYNDTFQAGKTDGTIMTNQILQHESYEEYLLVFSRSSDEVLLNIRDYQKEVINGEMTMEKWMEVFGNAIRHYKQLCPNLKYIEVLNEYDISSMVDHFPVTSDQYYLFYKAAYQVVNKINADLQPDVPLVVGGPCLSAYNKSELEHFMDLYAKDGDPHKRLDFVSFH